MTSQQGYNYTLEYYDGSAWATVSDARNIDANPSREMAETPVLGQSGQRRHGQHVEADLTFELNWNGIKSASQRAILDAVIGRTSIQLRVVDGSGTVEISGTFKVGGFDLSFPGGDVVTASVDAALSEGDAWSTERLPGALTPASAPSGPDLFWVSERQVDTDYNETPQVLTNHANSGYGDVAAVLDGKWKYTKIANKPGGAIHYRLSSGFTQNPDALSVYVVAGLFESTGSDRIWSHDEDGNDPRCAITQGAGGLVQFFARGGSANLSTVLGGTYAWGGEPHIMAFRLNKTASDLRGNVLDSVSNKSGSDAGAALGDLTSTQRNYMARGFSDRRADGDLFAIVEFDDVFLSDAENQKVLDYLARVFDIS